MIALALFAILCATSADVPHAKVEKAEVVRGVDKALAFLVTDQNPDGSWGSACEASFNDLWTNPETHRAWKVGTTGVACMALLEAGEKSDAQASLARAIDYLVALKCLERCSDWDLDDVWGYLYGLQALSRVLISPRIQASPKRAEIEKAARTYLEKLARYQAPLGGFGYYAYAGSAYRPNWSVSFLTAAAILAFGDARAAGLNVDERLYARSVSALERTRLPTGAYTYSLELIPNPGSLEGIDQVEGSLGRIQVGNLALHAAGRPVTIEAMHRGIDQFFEHHRYLEICRLRPIPHEAYHFNAGYFYCFGHYYAALVIGELAPADRRAYAERLARILLDVQEKPGWISDYVMHSYPRFYGTAYSLMALHRSAAMM